MRTDQKTLSFRTDHSTIVIKTIHKGKWVFWRSQRFVGLFLLIHSTSIGQAVSVLCTANTIRKESLYILPPFSVLQPHHLDNRRWGYLRTDREVDRECSFPWVHVINCHKPNGLKQKCIVAGRHGAHNYISSTKETLTGGWGSQLGLYNKIWFCLCVCLSLTHTLSFLPPILPYFPFSLSLSHSSGSRSTQEGGVLTV